MMMATKEKTGDKEEREDDPVWLGKGLVNGNLWLWMWLCKCMVNDNEKVAQLI